MSRRARRGGRLGAAAAALALTRLCGTAAAASEDGEHPPIQLELHPCVPVDAAAVRQVLAIELGAQVTAAAAAPDGVTRVRVDCADAQVWLQVDDPLTGKSLLRRIDFYAVDPRARSRLIGLAVTELVSASWTELLANPRPQGVPPAPEVPPAVRRAALAAVQRTARGRGARTLASGPRLSAVAAVSGLFSGAGVLAGGGVRLGLGHRRHLGWAVDLLTQHGSAGTPLGRVAIDTVSSGGVLLFQRSFPRAVLHAGGGFRLGVGSLRGQPAAADTGNLLATGRATGGSVLGLWGGPTLAVGAGVRVRRLVAEAAIEGGYTAFAVRGTVDEATAVDLAGPWLGVQVGLGFLP